MTKDQNLPRIQRWAQLRFAIIGSLLAQPPVPGELRPRLMELSAQSSIAGTKWSEGSALRTRQGRGPWTH
jgi:hypothetical protein